MPLARGEVPRARSSLADAASISGCGRSLTAVRWADGMSRGSHRDRFVVESPSGHRFDVALSRLVAGHTFAFEHICCSLLPNGVLACSIDSSWSPENVTVETATSDFAGASASLNALLAGSEKFAALARGKPTQFELIDDYGSGTVLLCTLSRGDLVWSPGFPKRPSS